MLGCAAGETHTAIAADLHVTKQTVGKWRRRFVEAGVPGLLDEPRPGARRRVTDAAVERAICHDAGVDAARCDAVEHAILGQAGGAESRPWPASGRHSHSSRTGPRRSSCRRIPLFIEKVRDIVGLYLHPPDRALVLCRLEEPDPGPRPYGSLAADAARPTRTPHA